MKAKFLFIVVIALCSIKAASAQTYFGFSGGLNLSTMVKKFNGKTEIGSLKPGIHAGVFVEIPVSQSFSLQPELNYSQMGTRFKDDNGAHFTPFLNYVSLPILAKYRYPDAYFGFYAGPQIAYLINAKDEYSLGTVDMSNYYKKVNFSLTIGTNYTFWEKIFLDARFQMSITDLSKDTEFGPSLKNAGITLGMGYKFY